MMDKNNLGSFNSLQELWEAHPEGGHEGDYATINGVVFRWNKYNRIWSGTGTPMETYGRKTDLHEGDVVINNDLTVGGIIRARGVKQPNKGLFHDLASLQKRYPFPEVGWWATVGDSVPGQIYRCDQTGVWSATGETGGLDYIDYENLENAVKNAESAADKANKMADRANSAAANASDMAVKAEQAAGAANSSASSADLATKNATEKASAADAAAKSANSAATFATEKGNFAQEQVVKLQGRIDIVENIAGELINKEQERDEAEQQRNNDEQLRKDNESARIKKESERAAAETERISAEQQRASEFSTLKRESENATSSANAAASNAISAANSAKATTQAANKINEDINKAEQSRLSAETQRVKSELARIESESVRQQNENSRVSKESLREVSETERKSAESDRVRAESDRANEEVLRKSAESGRKSNESERAAAESSRAEAEATRAANEEQRKKNESTRTSAEAGRVEAEKGRVAAESARVTEFARLKSESETATKNATDAAEEAKEVSSGVAALERDLGQYAELPSVAMTAETTGKYINADGEFVDDADFNIAAIGAVVVGNTYELYMGGADKMKLGVALFVSRIKTTTTSGTERIEYVPLFSAMSTDIPTSGYVCFEAMEAYSDVLVCYRADLPEAATLLVRRYGTKASIATQINNLRKKVDLKSFTDGYYESMRVGTADNLTSKGDATEEVIMSRRAGGDNQIEDGSASIKRIKGYSVVKNQLFNDGKGPFSGSTTIESTGVNKYKCTPNIEPNNAGTAQWASGWATLSETLPVGHIFFYRMLYTRISKREDVGEFEPRPSAVILDEYTYNYFSPELGKETIVCNVVKGTFGKCAVSLNDCIVTLENIQLIDLTQMFGPGKEPSTPEDFAKRLGYDSIDNVPYIPYNEGEIVSSFAEGIKTTDTEGKVSERKWSETLKKYFPDGLKSAGSVFDEITPTKAVKRIGMLKLWEYNWMQGGLNRRTSWTMRGKNFKGVAVLAQGNDKKPNLFSSRFLADSPFNVERQNYDKTATINTTGWLYIYDAAYETATPEQVKQSLQGVMLYYEMATSEETTYDELNLTEQVAEGGTEEAIITEGKTSTPLRADIVYPIDAYNTIKANKANIGTLSSLNTASKTDLVSAINELAGKLAALEANATEVTNETTE